MFDLGQKLTDAVGVAYDNTLGNIFAWFPDWFMWLISLPYETWVIAAICFVGGYVYGKWGLAPLILIGGLLVTVFTLGRKSKK